MHNADIITDLDYRAMLRSHEQSGADATLLTAPRATSRYLLFNDDNRLRGWYNRSTGATIPDGIDPGAYCQLAFGGVHIISPQRFFPALERYADGRMVFPVIPFYTSARDSLDIRSYCPPTGSYRWADIGKPESLEAASKLFQ